MTKKTNENKFFFFMRGSISVNKNITCGGVGIKPKSLHDMMSVIGNNSKFPFSYWNFLQVEIREIFTIAIYHPNPNFVKNKRIATAFPFVGMCYQLLITFVTS
jgi:hypothetical protein